ncbi:hypothetical protein WUBG_13691, partial [Wuchereria bancrofti]
VVLIYRNSTATPDHNPSFDYDSQHHTDNQRTSGFKENEESQQKIGSVLDDKSVNNVHIQIFLVTPNKTSTNSNIRINDLRNKEIGKQFLISSTVACICTFALLFSRLYF